MSKTKLLSNSQIHRGFSNSMLNKRAVINASQCKNPVRRKGSNKHRAGKCKIVYDRAKHDEVEEQVKAIMDIIGHS